MYVTWWIWIYQGNIQHTHSFNITNFNKIIHIVCCMEKFHWCFHTNTFYLNFMLPDTYENSIWFVSKLLCMIYIVHISYMYNVYITYLIILYGKCFALLKVNKLRVFNRIIPKICFTSHVWQILALGNKH